MKCYEAVAFKGIDGRVRYVRTGKASTEWWYTDDINLAKVWRRPGYANRWVMHQAQWAVSFERKRDAGLSLTVYDFLVIDPRSVEGYVKVPTPTERRRVERFQANQGMGKP